MGRRHPTLGMGRSCLTLLKHPSAACVTVLNLVSRMRVRRRSQNLGGRLDPTPSDVGVADA